MVNTQITNPMASNNTSFKPGQSGCPGGINKKMRIKNQLESLLEKALPAIEQEMETASPADRRAFFIGLAGVVLPSNKVREPSIDQKQRVNNKLIGQVNDQR